MVAITLSLLAATGYGVGDFFGGIASRRTSATSVVLCAHIVGLVFLAVCAPLAGGDLTVRDAAVGALAGVAGAVGLALMYHALSLGAMSVVAPTTALLSAALPVVVGVGIGDRPTATGAVGTALALPAIGMITLEGPLTRAGRDVRRIVGLSLASGLCFGTFFVVLAGVDASAGLWPLVGARSASVVLFTGLAAAGVTSAVPDRSALRPAIAGGLLDAVANVCLLLALTRGLLPVVAVLTAMYPAGTVLLARFVLGERLTRSQRTGLAVAALSAALISL